MTQSIPASGFELLKKHQYANLFTFRKSGEAVKTPVWFALHDGKVYVVTTRDAGKVKRIRNGGRVQLGPADRTGTPLGPIVEGRARILPPEEIAAAKTALDDKYGLFKAVFDFFMTVGGTEREYIEIRPGEA